MKKFRASQVIGICILLSKKIFRRLMMIAYRPLFKNCGKKVVFCPYDSFSYQTISLGSDVFIGEGAIFQATESSISIGNKVMFGPRVTIMGGNHNTREIGQFMYDVKTKDFQDDLPVVIEDDIWVGTGVIILKGVTLGRGCIVGAGAIVTKSIPPYTVVVGAPARIISLRFKVDEIIEHEAILYPVDQRLSRLYLVNLLGEHI